MRSNARLAPLPILVPKDRFGARVHQVRFSICREEVQDGWQDRVVQRGCQSVKGGSYQDKGLGKEGSGVNQRRE